MTQSIKRMMLAALLVVVAMVNADAQFYGTLSAGKSFEAGKSELTNGGNEGSYGEGTQYQLRLGNYITKNLAIELGVGYLAGAEKDVLENPLGVDVNGTPKAWGAALTAKYDFGGLYARGGFLTKVGGHTEVNAVVNTQLPATLFNPQVPAGLNADVKADIVRKNNGKFPTGFVAALGYDLDLSDNLGLFVEVQYEGIGVQADKSTLESFTGSVDIAGQSLPLDTATLSAQLPKLVAAGAISQADAGSLGALLLDEFTYGSGTIPEYKSPYSNIGIYLGVTFKL